MSINALDELLVQYEVLREEEVVFAVSDTHNYCLIHKSELNSMATVIEMVSK